MIFDLLLTFFLVALNGFFVAAEFAMVKVRAAQVEIKVSEGSRPARFAGHILKHLDAYLSATQLGITIASLGLGWIGESVVSDIIINIFHSVGYEISDDNAHKIAFPVAFALITVLHIVFGELAPKSLAIRYPLDTTLAVSIPMRGFYLLFKPFIWSLNGFANFILKLIGITPIHGDQIHTEEEIRLILVESEQGGAIKPSEHELIQNVFEFDNRIVKQIYVPRTKMVAIDIDLPGEQVIDFILEHGFSRMPVYKDSLDNIIGIIYTKDLLKSIHHREYDKIQDLIRPAYFVPMSKKINDLLHDFQAQHIQMAIVTNEFGGTAGLLTLEDIIEELVGEIQDEYDEEKPIVEEKPNNEYIVSADAAISDINDYLPYELPESPHYDTLSGLVNYIFARIPNVDEKMEYREYEFTILKRYKHSVESVKLRLLKPLQNDEKKEEDED